MKATKHKRGGDTEQDENMQIKMSGKKMREGGIR